jgi:tetratricopeptide (TPR) repeat protein
MDFDILPQTIIVLSLAGILFIIGRNYSKVKEASASQLLFMETTAEAEREKAKLAYLYKRAVRRLNKENYQKTVARFWLWFEKTLRKLRIAVLKLDGKMVSYLEELRKKNTESFLKLKETERNIRRNMENENFSKFWSAKKNEIKSIGDLKAASQIHASREEETAEAQAVPLRLDTAAFDSAEKEKQPEGVGVLAFSEETEEDYRPKVYKVEAYSTATAGAEAGKPEEKAAEPVVDSVTPEPAREEPKMENKKAKGRKSESINPEETELDAGDSVIRTKKEQEYIEILMKDPHDIKAYWKLGLIYSKRRNYADALACCRQIVKIDPTYTKAKQKALEIMEKMKKKEK